MFVHSNFNNFVLNLIQKISNMIQIKTKKTTQNSVKLILKSRIWQCIFRSYAYL
jgi:hypothetical protein